MARSSDDILSVSQVRAELRIPDGATATRVVDLDPVTGSTPLHFDAAGLREVTAVKYWTVLTGNLRADPDGVIDGADLGDATVSGSQAVLQSPFLGWPDVLAGSSMRVEFVAGAQDSLLQAQIDAAISFISHEQPAPLIDQTETILVEPVAGDDQLVFAAVGAKSITEIKYWTKLGALRSAPDGTIAGADLGRVVPDRRCASVYGPVGGWPQVLGDSRFEVVFVRGIADALIPAFRAAVASQVRHHYDGFREIRPTESFVRLSRSLRG